MAKANKTIGPLPNSYGPYPNHPEFHIFESAGIQYRFTHLQNHIFEMILIEDLWWGYYYHENTPMKVGGTIETKNWLDLGIDFVLTQV